MSEEVNGVFEGGGAKGIAYMGALKACDRRGLRFKAVAGSSAGAITATLVACGYPITRTTATSSTESVETLMSEVLRKFESVTWSMAKLHRPSLLSNKDLLTWLQDKIADRPNRPADHRDEHACTFAELADGAGATGSRAGIALYVVTLDLGTRQPLVFGPDTELTPGSPVAEAVLASSAIPVAFPPMRMLVPANTVSDTDEVANEARDAASVHRLVDGGTWSNYPSFVFLDRDFRDRHQLGDNTRRTIGFILDDERHVEREVDDETATGGANDTGSSRTSEQRHGPRPDRGRTALLSDEGSIVKQLGIPGAIMSSNLFLWSVALVPVLFSVLALLWLRSELTGPEPVTRFVVVQLQDLVMIGSVAVLALTGLAAVVIGLVVVRLGRTLFDTGVVGASSAMGVGPSVPYWVGAAHRGDAGAVEGGDPVAAVARGEVTTDAHRTDHYPVRITVPKALGTLAFNPPESVRKDAIERGFSAALNQLPGPPTHDASAETGDTDAGRTNSGSGESGRSHPVRWVFEQLGERWWLRTAVLIAALFVGTTAAFEVMIDFADHLTWTTPVWLGLAGSAVVVDVLLIAHVRQREAKQKPYPRLGELPPGVLYAGAVVAISIGVAVVLAPGDYDASFFRVLRADALDGTIDTVTPSGSDGGFDVTVRLEDDQLFDAKGEVVGFDTYFTFYELADQINYPDAEADELGRQVRESGEPVVDKSGNFVDEFGFPVDEFGDEVDELGALSDEDFDELSDEELDLLLDDVGFLSADSSPWPSCVPPKDPIAVRGPYVLRSPTREKVRFGATESENGKTVLCVALPSDVDVEVGSPATVRINLDSELAFIDDGRLRSDLKDDVELRILVGFALVALALRAIRVARWTQSARPVGARRRAAAERH